MSLSLKSITTRLGYQQLTGMTGATKLTVPSVDLNGLCCRPAMAVIIGEAKTARWRDDDVAPTTTVGMPLAAGITLQYDGDLSKIQFIETESGAILNVSYYA